MNRRTNQPRKTLIFLPVWVLAGLLGAAPVSAMQPLDDSDMGEVVAREGIAAELELRANADESGQPLNSACDSANGVSTALAQTDCRLALQFANRPGDWLVVKGFYGTVKIPTLHIDSGRTPVSSTQYEDLSRFEDESGNPLIATPHDVPVVTVSFPEDIEIWNLTAEGMAIEYDGDGASPDGFNNNQYGSFLGVKISNSVSGQPATLSAEGRASIYGF